MKYLGPSYRQNNQPFKIGDIPMGGFVQVEFVKIVDGDTAHFLLDGKEVTVRFLVINTPHLCELAPCPLVISIKLSRIVIAKV